ncbi:MAG: hypothetical protein GY785_24715 [Gammaproteobacteria bacterium]|nr:hypothetical protein [Gammaproteobacteria bacterium]
MKASNIFHKTTKGQAEIDSRSGNLSMKDRRVLILINGANDCNELKRLSLCDNIAEILATLIDGDFIDDGTSAITAIPAQDYSSQESKKSQKEPTDDEAAEFMCNTLLTFANHIRVGKLIEQIKAADSADGLKELVKPWYTAISDTPGGMYQADDLRAEVLKKLADSDI